MGAPALIASAFGLIWNTSASLPRGLWHKTDAFAEEPNIRGRYVVFCPPDNAIFSAARQRKILAPGRCSGNYMPLIKQVIGVPNDQITVDSSVAVNRVHISNSDIRPDVAAVNGPKIFNLAIAHFWLMSTYTSKSFDSRYFGAIDSNQIEAFVEPLLTW